MLQFDGPIASTFALHRTIFFLATIDLLEKRWSKYPLRKLSASVPIGTQVILIFKTELVIKRFNYFSAPIGCQYPINVSAIYFTKDRGYYVNINPFCKFSYLKILIKPELSKFSMALIDITRTLKAKINLRIHSFWNINIPEAQQIL